MSGHPRSVTQNENAFMDQIEIQVDSQDRNGVSHREQCIDYLLIISEMESEIAILQRAIQRLESDNTILPRLSLNLAP